MLAIHCVQGREAYNPRVKSPNRKFRWKTPSATTGAPKRVPDHTSKWETTMFDSVSPAESEPIGVVSSGWLRAARRSALICTIALGVGFVAEAAAHDPVVALFSFGPWGSLSLALLYLLFRRGKNSLAFALGLGAATAFIALLPVASMLSRSGRHLAFFIVVFSGILPPFANLMSGLHPQLATLGALLLCSSVSLWQCSG